MDFRNFAVVLLTLTLLVQCPVIQSGPRMNVQCEDLCHDLSDGYYPCSRSCHKYVYCRNHVMEGSWSCPHYQEWDDDGKTCSSTSSTCPNPEPEPETEPESRESTSSTTSRRPSTKPTTTTQPTTTTMKSTSLSSSSSTSTTRHTSQTPDSSDETTWTKSSSITSSASPVTPKQNSSTMILQCSAPGVYYIFLLSGFIWIFPAVPCLVCWKTGCCKRKKKTTGVSISTQTAVRTGSRRSNVDNDDHYDDICLPNQELRYTPLPYAVSNNYQYQELQNLPNYEDLVNEGNVYLELHGYAYLQMQDVELRNEIDKTLAPLVVQLCNKYKTDLAEYKSLVRQVVELVDESKTGGKSALQVVIEDLKSKKNVYS